MFMAGIQLMRRSYGSIISESLKSAKGMSILIGGVNHQPAKPEQGIGGNNPHIPQDICGDDGSGNKCQYVWPAE